MRTYREPIRWGPFCTRIPGIHVRLDLVDFVQGGFVALMTGGVVGYLFTTIFGLPFEVAWFVMVFQLFFVWSQTFLFGDPYAPGWITPALPLVLFFLGAFQPGPDAVKAMTAVMLLVGLVFLFFGITGLGKRFISWLPPSIKAGIILGAAVSAFLGEYGRIISLPITCLTASGIAIFLMFSPWIGKIRKKHKSVFYLASLAYLAGLVVAGISGYIGGELSYSFRWGFYIPPVSEYFAMMMPYSIGWPTFDMFFTAIPLVFAIYVIAFGDMITGEGIITFAKKVRDDPDAVVDHKRSHLALAIRNLLHLFIGGPFIPLHGPIWTGVTAFVWEKFSRLGCYKRTVYEGTTSFYMLAFVLMFLWPAISLAQPLLPIALHLTLILTAIVCAYVSLGMVKHRMEYITVILMATVIGTYGITWGIIVGIIAHIALIGFKKEPEEN
jgi:hypothetical protein